MNMCKFFKFKSNTTGTLEDVARVFDLVNLQYWFFCFLTALIDLKWWLNKSYVLHRFTLRPLIIHRTMSYFIVQIPKINKKSYFLQDFICLISFNNHNVLRYALEIKLGMDYILTVSLSRRNVSIWHVWWVYWYWKRSYLSYNAKIIINAKIKTTTFMK